MRDKLLRPDTYLTTRNTGYCAGTWHDRGDQPMYFTEEYIDYIAARDRLIPTVRESLDEAASIPEIGFNNQNRPRDPRLCENPECGKTFIPTGARQKACSPACRDMIRKQKSRQWWIDNAELMAERRRLARQEEGS